jgi:hypothetical protein
VYLICANAASPAERLRSTTDRTGGFILEGTTVKRRQKDPEREDRIHNEAIVDAYGPEEQAMGWYYYLEGKLRFPFQAQCIASKVVSPLRKGETVEVRRLAPEDACSKDMLVLFTGKAEISQSPCPNWPL